MGLLRDLGKFAGKATGTVIGGAINVVGDVTGSKFINEVGDGVKKASEFAGDTVGQIADGAWNTASGLIQDDKHKMDQGLNDMGDSVGRTAKGVYHTAKNTYGSGKTAYEGFRDGDDIKVKQGLRDIGKTVAISTLAVGMVDLVDGADGGDPASSTQNMADAGTEGVSNVQYAETHVAQTEVASTTETPEQPGTHQVQPHWVEGHWRDGVWIEGYWRDGDGNTAVNLSEEDGGGYLRTDADGNPTNNLNS
ncbi:DUF3892 domain-containing protein [Metabacillus litoralis]|uniref:DUF3892 domain-containing protein n=1 Tax=Metabacillus litoralis TaxID=152268 RepID=A0A5C6V0M4_9BACI|nr:DUF3892 domain-containing protein [Metabacillus litoralis]TXC78494.1 DUF3892 domain-containing protein [Metabacillus litoralis]